MDVPIYTPTSNKRLLAPTLSPTCYQMFEFLLSSLFISLVHFSIFFLPISRILWQASPLPDRDYVCPSSWFSWLCLLCLEPFRSFYLSVFLLSVYDLIITRNAFFIPKLQRISPAISSGNYMVLFFMFKSLIKKINLCSF